jgi:hypothetical protein
MTTTPESSAVVARTAWDGEVAGSIPVSPTITISVPMLHAGRNFDAKLAQMLADAGLLIGPMLWTATPYNHTIQERRAFWNQALERAGVIRCTQRFDDPPLCAVFTLTMTPQAYALLPQESRQGGSSAALPSFEPRIEACHI